METTFNEHGQLMLEWLRYRRERVAGEARGLRDGTLMTRLGVGDAVEKLAELDAAGRDYSLAVTHLEDALTRHNSGRYHEDGTWNRRDPDRSQEPHVSRCGGSGESKLVAVARQVRACCRARIDAAIADGVPIGSCSKCGRDLTRLEPEPLPPTPDKPADPSYSR